MTIEQMLSKLREKRQALKEELTALSTLTIEEDRELTEEEATRATEVRSEIEKIEDRVMEIASDEARGAEAAEAMAKLLGTGVEPRIEVKSEPLTYRKGGEHSYFRDLAKRTQQGGEDIKANERIMRHAQEMDVEVRANMTRTDGAGGEFVPPLWLMDQYVPLARAGRVTAELCRKLPLPPGTDSINLPKINVGSAAAEQTDGNTVQKTDMTTTSVSGAVTTMAGQQVFAMQLLDQSATNFDEVVFADLLADLAAKVDQYVINKASIGILNVTSIIAVTYTDATPTVPELYPKVADGIQQIGTQRVLPAQAIVMHPRRWGWHLAALDGNSRPLIVPNAQGPTNAFAGMDDVRAEGSVGSLQGLPVYVDANVPINLGGGTNEDRIIEARFDDLYLYEGDIRTRVLFETDADTLSVRLQVWEYMAFIGSRYPKAIAVVAGTGLITPTF